MVCCISHWCIGLVSFSGIYVVCVFNQRNTKNYKKGMNTDMIFLKCFRLNFQKHGAENYLCHDYEYNISQFTKGLHHHEVCKDEILYKVQDKNNGCLQRLVLKIHKRVTYIIPISLIVTCSQIIKSMQSWYKHSTTYCGE